METDRLARALDAIDAANANDPHTILIDGVSRPKELAHAELMTRWVRTLDPDCSDEQLLAARAHHLRRWTIPRDSYPGGRAGYLRWRTALKRQHADDVGEILRAAGYDDQAVARVQAIVRKQGLGSDPAVQVHEDALCLVFLETQLDELAGKLGDDKTIDVLQKTAKKMSPAGLRAALGLRFAPDAAALLERALAPS
jgi:predicted Zn-dependent protease